MSFILDALRKVEEERKRAATPEEHSQIHGGRDWGESRVLRNLSLVAVALLAIVAIALSAYNLLQSNRAPLVERTAEIAPVPAPVPPPVSSAPARPPQVVQFEFPPFKGDTPAPTEAATTPDARDALEEPEPEPAPPVRLVGKPVRPGTSTGRDSISEPPVAAETSESTSEVLSSREPQQNPVAMEADLTGLPNLVLQGTATVEDRHVAIVNYQRVFEGDIIEGARVVKILDRAIELEFSGRRYTLRF